MISEIICVGTELLLGETANTNASYISQKLANIGIDCYYQTTVGDNFDRIKNVLDIALKRADIIIFTGGLGPTDDDITVQAIANYFHEELIVDTDTLDKLGLFFKNLNRHMPESNKKQALIPHGSVVISNPQGTAPGIIWEIPNYNNSKKIIITFPGVTGELYAMWEETAEKYLKQYSEGVLLSRHLKFFGISEAALGEKVRDLLNSKNPTIAPLADKGEARLRIAAKAKNKKAANKIIDKMENEILSRLGEYFYGYGEQTLEEVVAEILLEKQLTVSIAESCTGGLLSSRLTDISGSSNYVKLNFVTYSNESKIEALGINRNIIENYGAVSDKTAISMAMGVRFLSKCDIGIGITGIAGPTGATETKPVGLVYIGLCDKFVYEVHEVRINSNLKRKDIKYLATQHALNYLRLFLKKELKPHL